MYLVADFETTVLPDTVTSSNLKELPITPSVEVWLACFCEVGKHDKDENFVINYDIKDFMYHVIEYCENNNPYEETVVFFHNLKFDGSYITHFLLRNNIEFEHFIDDMGMWFSITIETDKATIVFRDSLKVLNFSLGFLSEHIIKDVETLKGDTPLLLEKPKQEDIKKEWLDYIINDVRILGIAIKELYFERGFTKFTSASESLFQFKQTVDFDNLFPTLTYEEDREIRQGYKGAWTYVKESIKGKPIKKRIKVYDENSKYPSVMLHHELPYGYPTTYDKFVDIKEHECAVYKVLLNFDLKPKHLPTIQAQTPQQAFNLCVKTTDYLKTTREMPEWFVLTNYDIELLQKHYYVDIIKCEWTKVFKTKIGIFDEYIHKYQAEKEHFKSIGDEFGVLKAKIMLNSLYGKFGAKTESSKKNIELVDGVLKFGLDPIQIDKPIYLPVAMFITSIGRYEIITDAQNNYDDFLYCDTDSLHVVDSGSIDLDIDPVRFGAWDLEEVCSYGVYLRSKLYLEVEEDTGEVLVKGAGMTKDVKKVVTKENFKIGAIYKNAKKTLRQVKGGVAIVKTDFKINEDITLTI